MFIFVLFYVPISQKALIYCTMYCWVYYLSVPSGSGPGDFRLPPARSGTGGRAFRLSGAGEAAAAHTGLCCQMWTQTRYVSIDACSKIHLCTLLKITDIHIVHWCIKKGVVSKSIQLSLSSWASLVHEANDVVLCTQRQSPSHTLAGK